MLRRWWDGFLHEASYQLVIAIIAAIALATWAVFRPMVSGWQWPAALFVFALVFAVVLFAFSQLRQALEQMKQQRLKSAPASVLAETIRSWLYDNGYAVANSAQPNTTFSLDVTDPLGRGYTVLQQRDRPNTLLVGTTYGFQPKDLPLVDRLPFSVVRGLRIELARLGLDWKGLSHPLREVTIVVSLSVTEQLTEARLFEAIRHVRSGSILLTELVQVAVEQIGESPQPEQAH